jgi:type IV secretory pathway VirB3-like protein
VPLVLFLTLSRSALMVGLTLELVAFVLLFAFPLIALSAFSISLHDGLQCSKRQR